MERHNFVVIYLPVERNRLVGIVCFIFSSVSLSLFELLENFVICHC